MKLVVLTCIVTGCCLARAEDVTVHTQYGAVLGSVLSFPNATGPIKSVRRFLGIPFASPPVRKLRFRSPEAPKNWKPSTYDARHWRNVCIQPVNPFIEDNIKVFWPNFTDADYSEDCLFLNIFTPGNSSGLFPVMVYIHGGGYVVGASVFRPGDLIALQGVVVVTIQYRLGVLGFLSTGDKEAPGNFGMLDQVQALKWVKQNIRRFNGDPGKVTIFGLSAGGASVALHQLSPLSKGLFHRAISESGVDVAPWATETAADAARTTRSLAELMGCIGASEQMVDCLRSKPAKKLALMGARVAQHNSKRILNIAWSPAVDNNFLPDTPQVLRKEGKFHKVPFLAGFTSHEFSSFLNRTLRQAAVVASVDAGVTSATFLKTLNTYGIRLANNQKPKAALVSEALQFEYTPWPETSNPDDLRKALIDMYSDRSFVVPTIGALSAHSKLAPAFMFLFSHISKLNKRPAWMGARHGDSTLYVFGVPFMDVMLLEYDETDRNVSAFMMQTYTNFAKTGNPTPEPVNGVQWIQFTASNQTYLDIDGVSPNLGKNYAAREVAFWNWYLPKLIDTKFDEERPTVYSMAPRFVPLAGFAETFLSLLVALLINALY